MGGGKDEFGDENEDETMNNPSDNSAVSVQGALDIPNFNPSAVIFAHDLPPWIADAVSHLCDGVCDDPSWSQLLAAWVNFERVLGFPGGAGRVSAWVNRGDVKLMHVRRIKRTA